MSMTNTIANANRTITAFFDTKDAAEGAISDLAAAGVARDQITLTAGASGEAQVVEDKSFWEELKDLFLPDEDRGAYAEGLRRGGFLLTVRATETSYDKALEILDRDGSVDMSERETSWRTEGWQNGREASAVSTLSTGASAVDRSQAIGTSSASAPVAQASSASSASLRDAAMDRDATVPIVEEQLQVGKRDVSHGKVRLRSYVVETPVNQQVNLRSESVEVERRPVDRAIGADDAVFKDRTIEVEERAEEAVVSKTAWVTEEVSLRKVAGSETQNISDSVRRTEVEVDDGRDHKAVGLAGAVGASQIGEHMDVIASDGQKIGTVDHMDGQDRIKLAKTTSPDGQHHFIPMAWVDHVDQHVHLNKPKQQVQQSW